jgi:hypothetical protein
LIASINLDCQRLDNGETGLMQPPDVFHCKACLGVIDAEVVKAVNASLKGLSQMNRISQRPATDLSCRGRSGSAGAGRKTSGPMHQLEVKWFSDAL